MTEPYFSSRTDEPIGEEEVRRMTRQTAVLAEGGSDHAELVKLYAGVLALQATHDPKFAESFAEASIYHDIGMLEVPDDILRKKGPLTSEEKEAVHRHARAGLGAWKAACRHATIISSEADRMVGKMIENHHERMDGTGYPLGLKGRDVPYEARLMALIDVYDALTSERPWREKMTPEQAAEFIGARAGTQFDAQLVGSFMNALPSLKYWTEKYQEKAENKDLAEKFSVGRMPVYEMRDNRPVFSGEFLDKISALPPKHRNLLKQYALMNDPELIEAAMMKAGDPSVSLPPARLSRGARELYAAMQKEAVAYLNDYTQEEVEFGLNALKIPMDTITGAPQETVAINMCRLDAPHCSIENLKKEVAKEKEQGSIFFAKNKENTENLYQSENMNQNVSPR